MIIPCIRCGIELDSPDSRNADYVIAEDTIVEEEREVKMASLVEGDKKVEKGEVESLIKAREKFGSKVKVRSEMKMKRIQKTGIICPECYLPTDTVIWGIHKGG